MAPEPERGRATVARIGGARRGGRRGLVLLGIAAAGLWAARSLGLDPGDLVPGEGGLRVARDLFSRALSPAWTYEARVVPEGTRPLLLKALDAAGATVSLAVAAISLALFAGLPLGFAASTATWVDEPTARGPGAPRRLLRSVSYGAARLLIALLRSVHELLWAVLLLAAMGLSQLSAVVAIAIPYAGTLAKVFSEILDEAPRESASALRASGASPAQVFLFGLLPRALPDMCAYAFYRFECALRSSAVLGFFGFPTLGYYLAVSFENLHYGEVWTYLYTLLGLVLLADLWSRAIRRRLSGEKSPRRTVVRTDDGPGNPASSPAESRSSEIRRLFRLRPRSRFLRHTSLALGILVVLAWSNRALWPRELLSPRRLANLERFLGELRPYPLQGQPFDLSIALDWAGTILAEKGWAATGTTLALAVAAIVLAAIGALLLTLPAARTVANPQPFLPALRPPSRLAVGLWRGLVTLVRGALIVCRSIPEYIWAFLFLAILGPTAWPVVLALAVHNFGTLGKLGAEVVENLDERPLAALRSLGATRLQIAAAAIFPITLPRFLLFFFYRWETCVREATVLGMLGISSLGFWIVDARARNHYDEMFFFVLLGAGLVLLGDLVSALVREVVRRAA